MSDSVGYLPFDRVEPVADGVWTVDARPIRPAGLPLPLRMTVLRLSNGDLLLYSPTRHTAHLQREIEALGPIRHLVAPNIAHWMFLGDWQRACPGAKTWGAPGLRERRQVRAAGVRLDADLGSVAPSEWRDEIDQVLVTSGPFAEVALFHRRSRTLLVADLVLNVEGERMPPVARTFARLAGILAPNGQAPIYLRLLLKGNARAVAASAARLVAFAPQRVIVTHGRSLDKDATEQLRASLSDLLRAGRSGIGAPALIAAGLLMGIGVIAARRGKAALR